MTIGEFKKELDKYDDSTNLIFACEECFQEYDVECGVFKTHKDLDGNVTQVIFTINNNF